jgi:hypothetical protein
MRAGVPPFPGLSRFRRRRAEKWSRFKRLIASTQERRTDPMRKPLLAVAAAMTFAAAAGAQPQVAKSTGADERYAEAPRAWRIGDRPPSNRWRAIREHRRFMLPDPAPGGALAALDDRIVELDGAGAIVRFHSV